MVIAVFGLDIRPLRDGPGLDPQELDDAITERAEAAFSFLERLVAAPSTVGREHEAQGVVEQELKRLGFEVERLPIPDGIATDPLAGVPQLSYDGRFDVIGRSGAGQGPSLLLNGHIDVVPAEQPDRWASPPFEPRRDGDRLYGRGAGDMKGGFAMAALALDALRATAPDAIAGPLTFVSVIEEECTGNGTLAAARAGVLADAVILPEPTGLELLLAGVGILWLDVVITGRSAHAEAADRVVNPVDLAIRVVEALRDLEREMNADIELSMDGVAHPYNINVGTFAAGDWPSSVPAIATLRLRVGHPTAWTADEAEARVRRAIRRDRRTVAPGPSPGDPAFGLPSARATRCRRTIRSRSAWRRRTGRRTASDPGRPRWRARPTRGST